MIHLALDIEDPDSGDTTSLRRTGELSETLRSVILKLADMHNTDAKMQDLAHLIRYPRKQES